MNAKLALGIAAGCVVVLGTQALVLNEKLYQTRIDLINTKAELNVKEQLLRKVVKAMPNKDFIDFAADNLPPETFIAWGLSVLNDRK